MKFVDFMKGLTVGLISAAVLLTMILGLSVVVGFEGETMLLMTLIGFNIGLTLLGAGILVYYFAVVKGKINKDDRIKDLVLELNSIESAKKDIEKGYFQRNIDAESKKDIMNDLKRREAKVRNQIKILQDANGNDEKVDADDEE